MSLSEQCNKGDGIETNFTVITDDNPDAEIQEILRLTPYSGECYSICEIYLFKEKELEKAPAGSTQLGGI